MIYIPVSQSFSASLRIPESVYSDTVTYVIRKVSDGSVFASGTATFISNHFWKVTFTPAVVNETYLIEISDETLDVEVAETYLATLNQPVASDETEAVTASELLVKVNSAISARLNGGGVNSYRLQDGRNLEYMTLDELRAFRKELQHEVSSTKTQKQTTTHVRFCRPL